MGYRIAHICEREREREGGTPPGECLFWPKNAMKGDIYFWKIECLGIPKQVLSKSQLIILAVRTLLKMGNSVSLPWHGFWFFGLEIEIFLIKPYMANIFYFNDQNFLLLKKLTFFSNPCYSSATVMLAFWEGKLTFQGHFITKSKGAEQHYFSVENQLSFWKSRGNGEIKF